MLAVIILHSHLYPFVGIYLKGKFLYVNLLGKVSFKLLIETKIVKEIISVYPRVPVSLHWLTWHYHTRGKILLDFICFALFLKVILNLKCLKTVCIFSEHLFMLLACCMGVGCVYHCFWSRVANIFFPQLFNVLGRIVKECWVY